MSLAHIRPIDDMRIAASAKLDPRRRVELGQFMTPAVIADFMASLFQYWPEDTRLLDPGAGIGSLTEAFTNQWIRKSPDGGKLGLTAYEIEPVLLPLLKEHLDGLRARGLAMNRQVDTAIEEKDFIAEASFTSGFSARRFTHAILNPPYRKIGAKSPWRYQLRAAGIEAANLYVAFLGLAVALCEEGGEIVAIIPRSFCNGTYFRPFRKWLLERVAITHIHVFESRKKAFQDDDVLQENVIVRFVRAGKQGGVEVSTSSDAGFNDHSARTLLFGKIVKPGDTERFIHIPTGDKIENCSLFKHTLHELDLDVATGPVVDFRLKNHCLPWPDAGSVPLLYAHHFRNGVLEWPKVHKKPNAIRANSDTLKWLMPNGWYALTKRFSAKEEKRRIVAFVVEPDKLQYEHFGFENHLNVVHADKHGLPEEVARGIAVFLNSTVVDAYFRTFSGHTQVNATDLRTMRFPDMNTLVRFGEWAKAHPSPRQEEIDQLIENSHA